MSELSVRELWAQTADVVGTRHEARWLCEVAVGATGDEFILVLDEPVTERMVAHLDAMLARLRTGEPLQYVLGRWGFRRLDLLIDRRVLIPRPETELVAGVAIELAAARPTTRTVADLGTGSGAIGLALADELPLEGTTVWITDVSEAALAVARANLAGIGRAATNVRVGVGSWFEALPADQHFDVIVSNPPYVAEGSPELDDSVAAWEPAEALLAGVDGLDDICELVAGASERLRPGGWLVLEIGADQGDVVRRLFDDHDFVDVEIRHDLAGRDRVALGRRPGEPQPSHP
ncbi:MAG: peptide chain release factor N(5)-glutamine methyltransferase [Ilumatobacter sp.]|uniref:peptide chain release factor N(5)-glutamine methyltransferase n=1 Tax=Ilumatobacter sp. TaxID=1967498 RepID=UPI002637CB5B|nr:peptide chain release factor N(5)-glutamine methyltransferase [Ilumatobacter sp.]MDJ0769363.1 peptide chain release factor N(5)-glutamine methyltransferase [Ilumatobacter sp.]